MKTLASPKDFDLLGETNPQLQGTNGATSSANGASIALIFVHASRNAGNPRQHFVLSRTPVRAQEHCLRVTLWLCFGQRS